MIGINSATSMEEDKLQRRHKDMGDP